MLRVINLQQFSLRSISVLAVLILAALQTSAENKALKSEIEHTFLGKTAVSQVVLSCKATPRGYQGDYPAHTLVSPDGSVKYRVEFGLLRQDVGESEITQRLNIGTSVRVTSVDLKDDRLELKVESLNGAESAKLKLMFGNGWQSSMNADTVVHLLQKVLDTGQLPPNTESQSNNVRPPVVAPPARDAISASDVGLLVTNAATAQPIVDAEIQWRIQ